MKILLVGAAGQLGQELQLTCPKQIQLHAVTHAQCDITNATQVHQLVQQLKPNCIINAAAYNAVDLAEEQQALALAVNGYGPQNLAQAAYVNEARLIHVSTDYVFDGKKNASYLISDSPNPISYYGYSKLQGEQYALENSPNALVIRTSWVYSKHQKNFVKSLLQLLAQRTELNMVADQISNPTWAKNLALAIWHAVQKPELQGIQHWTDQGHISKYEFALAIQTEALQLGLLNKKIPLTPITSAEFPAAATRPLFSALDIEQTAKNLGFKTIAWRDALKEMLVELKHG